MDNLNKAENKTEVIPSLFFVVARDSEENWKLITQGIPTYDKAKEYRDSDFCKKRWEHAFIVCCVNETYHMIE